MKPHPSKSTLRMSVIDSFVKKIPVVCGILCYMYSTPIQAQTVDIYFGSLYNYDRNNDPTVVHSGTGVLGQAFAGHEFYWACLDVTKDIPIREEYTVTVDLAQVFGSFTDSMSSATMISIDNAIGNMFYKYQSQLVADVGSVGYNDLPFSGFQEAVWYIVEGYDRGVWSGELDAAGIAALIAWNDPEGLKTISQIPWIATMLSSALDDTVVKGQMFYALDPSNVNQAVVLFPTVPITIPEPGSLVLASCLGALTLVRRRRGGDA